LKDKILSAIKKIKKYDFTLAMSTYISPDHLDDFPKYMDLAKKLGFQEIILFPSFPS
jgi:MoaA/NifB/PqqE/SkfB family radical SAM enzyme